jgi:hypothetical protein
MTPKGLGDKGVVDTEVGAWGQASATFDRTRRYRYHLSRVWDREGPRINFLMLNPSTADALVVDPTVRRCLGFAKKWGAGSLEVTNIFALRATDPKELRRVVDPVGPANDEAIVESALMADLVVAAWGVHGVYLDREAHVRSLLTKAGVEVSVLQVTKDGHPGHPLYVAGDTRPVPWPLTHVGTRPPQ